MPLMHWDTWLKLDEVRGRLQRVFSNVRLARLGASAKLVSDTPARLDIVETQDEFLVTVELPEVGEGGVRISLHGGELRIEGEPGPEKDTQAKGQPAGGGNGSFLRTFTLSDDVDEQQIRANFKDGILNVHLPKEGGAHERTGEVKGSPSAPLGKTNPGAAKLVWRLRRAEDGSVVLLDAGDPLWTPPADAVEWDWDADSVSADHHCAYCGNVSAPLFKLEDGAIACGSCVHGSDGSR